MYTDKAGGRWYKVGLHIHTTLSDGRVTPEEAARIYREAGFDAIAITDHWKYHGEDTLSGIRILAGCEYNMGGSDTAEDVMHIVGVGMKRDPGVVRYQHTRQEVIDAINGAGGIAILAHPAWSLNTPAEATALSGFTATEIYNTVSDAHQSARPYSGYFVDLLANEGVAYPLIATDDAHYYDGTDETKSFVMVKADSDSTDDLLSAIRRRDCFATQGPVLSVRREGDKIVADCSECAKIVFFSNTAWAPDRVTRGERLTRAEYAIKAWDKWVRAEVFDADGNCAWSHVILL